MTLRRARIIKGAFPEGSDPPPTRRVELARRESRESLDAREEAARIVAEAQTNAATVLEAARQASAEIAANAAAQARAEQIARVCAEHIALRVTEEQRAARGLDRTVQVAVLLAERIIGEGLRIEPERIAAIAAEALRETRGARSVRIEASPEDVPALETLVRDVAPLVVQVEPNPELGRGSLVVHTELGRVDARLEPQLARLADALREALR